MMQTNAVVLNMFYTGLGIARSLGEQGVPVIGLSSQRIYGNYSRYAKTRLCPDSRNEPEALAAFLMDLGRKIGHRSVIFPTRDHDLVFLDRFREELAGFYSPVIAGRQALTAALDKWQTYNAALRAGVPTPKCWLIDGPASLAEQLPAVIYPCVLKPVAAHQWRVGRKWQTVGGRKAIAVGSEAELLREYGAIAHDEPHALLQEMVPGGDDALLIQACYLDRESKWVAGFNTQKLLQVPEGFGTGCIVQAADRPELVEPTLRLLQAIDFTGIAEVEYKWDSRSREYKLIEINPRPWDQHRLGKGCGTDLAYLAYCEHAGLGMPSIVKRSSTQKWIAEDAFLLTAAKMLAKRDGGAFKALLQQARGQRTYAIGSVKDPVPLLQHLTVRVVPNLAAAGFRALGSIFIRTPAAGGSARGSTPGYKDQTVKGEGHG